LEQDRGGRVELHPDAANIPTLDSGEAALSLSVDNVQKVVEVISGQVEAQDGAFFYFK
jgi:hypothetical protein